MKIFQFMEEYCQDLLQADKERKELLDMTVFPHDGVEQSPDGKDVPVVYVGDLSVPVSEFFTMSRDDFLYTYKDPAAAECYDNYVSALEIIEGEDVINMVRNSILAAKSDIPTLNTGDSDVVTMI